MATQQPNAVQIGERNGWLQVPVVVHELLSAASGHPIVVRTLDGQNVLLRLATPDEIQQFERESRAKHAANGIELNHPLMTRERAQELTAPLPIGW